MTGAGIIPPLSSHFFLQPVALSGAQEPTGDNHSLDFIGAFINLADLGIAHVAFRRIFLAIAVTAEDLDAFNGADMATSEAYIFAMADSFS
jgi:hypothetical protein